MKTIEDIGQELTNEICAMVTLPKSDHKLFKGITHDKINEALTSHTNEIIEKLEGMKYDDPRKGEHPHPEIKWTDCEACRENYTHNAAITQVQEMMRKTLEV